MADEHMLLWKTKAHEIQMSNFYSPITIDARLGSIVHRKDDRYCYIIMKAIAMMIPETCPCKIVINREYIICEWGKDVPSPKIIVHEKSGEESPDRTTAALMHFRDATVAENIRNLMQTADMYVHGLRYQVKWPIFSKLGIDGFKDIGTAKQVADYCDAFDVINPIRGHAFRTDEG